VRRILEQGQKDSATSDGVYVKAANGSLPVVVQAYNQVIDHLYMELAQY
jgi:hypothetical protein